MAMVGRGLSEGLLQALETLAGQPDGQWWRDVLAHPDLIVAVRKDTLNVYHRGASIFLIEIRNGAVVPTTHIKYLVRQQQAYVSLQGKSFAANPAAAIWQAYEGKQTLAEMMRAAAALAGPEKTGLHALIKVSPHVIDVELALASVAAKPLDSLDNAGANDLDLSDDGEPSHKQDRLDVVTLEQQDGGIALVFHEAKHFANTELRATSPNLPPVAEQIARYRRSLAQHAPVLITSYREVCRAHLRLHGMRSQLANGKGVPAPDPLIVQVADGAALMVDTEPRLVIFGFDEDQRDGDVWQMHLERLCQEAGLTVYAVGNPKAKRTRAFQERPRRGRNSGDPLPNP